MNTWIALTVIFVITAIVGWTMGKVRNESVANEETPSGLVVCIGLVGALFFGMMSLLCIVG